MFPDELPEDHTQKPRPPSRGAGLASPDAVAERHVHDAHTFSRRGVGSGDTPGAGAHGTDTVRCRSSAAVRSSLRGPGQSAESPAELFRGHERLQSWLLHASQTVPSTVLPDQPWSRDRPPISRAGRLRRYAPRARLRCRLFRRSWLSMSCGAGCAKPAYAAPRRPQNWVRWPCRAEIPKGALMGKCRHSPVAPRAGRRRGDATRAIAAQGIASRRTAAPDYGRAASSRRAGSRTPSVRRTRP